MGVWSISSTINDGYPFNSDLQGISYQVNFVGDFPKNVWHITSGINDGYPYIGYFIDISNSSGGMNVFPDNTGSINTNEKDIGNFNTVLKSGSITGGTMYYSLSATTVNDLITWLNSTYVPTNETEFIQDFKGVNPCDYITCIKYYPFDVPSVTPGRNITIGNKNTTFNGGELRNEYGTSYTFIDMGNIDIVRYYNDFRDFMTKILLIIPYCGIKEIDNKIFYGHNLNVKMSIDFTTGNCTAYIYRDNLLIDTLNGSCGVDINLTAINQGSYQNAIATQRQSLELNNLNMFGGALSAVGGAVSTVAGIATGNVMAGVGGALGLTSGISNLLKSDTTEKHIDYNIEHTAPTKTNICSASPYNNLLNEFNCRVLFYRPKTLQNVDFEVYKDTVGYASCIFDKIGNYSGFTVCTNIDTTGINASESELNMIKNLCENGIYI